MDFLIFEENSELWTRYNNRLIKFHSIRMLGNFFCIKQISSHFIYAPRKLYRTEREERMDSPRSNLHFSFLISILLAKEKNRIFLTLYYILSCIYKRNIKESKRMRREIGSSILNHYTLNLKIIVRDRSIRREKKNYFFNF